MNYKKLLLAVFCVCTFATQAQDGFVQASNIRFSELPLPLVEDNSIVYVSFDLLEVSGGAVPGSFDGNANLNILVDLSKMTLLNNNVSLIEGTLTEVFDLNYNAQLNQLSLSQKSNFEAESVRDIIIPIEVTENTENLSQEVLNGVLVTVLATNPKTKSGGSNSLYTFTQKSSNPNVGENINNENSAINTDTNLNLDSVSLEDENSLNVIPFPNPFTDSIELQLSSSIDYEVPYQIYDLNGKLISKGVYTKGDRITTGSFSSGVYILETTLKEAVVKTKINKI